MTTDEPMIHNMVMSWLFAGNWGWSCATLHRPVQKLWVGVITADLAKLGRAFAT